MAGTIALFLFLGAGNEARIDDEDDGDDDVVEHEDDIENDDGKNDYDYNDKIERKNIMTIIMLVNNTSGGKDDDDLETHSDDDNMNDDNKKSWCILPPNFLINYSAFSHDIMAAILVFQDYELEAILVSQTNHLFLCKRFLLLQ